MATKKDHSILQNTTKKVDFDVGLYDIPLIPLRTDQQSSLVQIPNISDLNKSSIKYNGFEYQLIPVEIEKDAELGLVVGQVESEPLVFIDEILPNGMIDIHGTLKEGDYLLQAGVYSLIGIDINIVLVLIERAYDEGRKSVSFVAARQEKPDRKNQITTLTTNKRESINTINLQELPIRTTTTMTTENKNSKQE